MSAVGMRLTGESWGDHRGSIVNAEPSWDKVYTIVEPGHQYDDFNVITEGDESYGTGWDGELVADITTFEVPDDPSDAIEPEHYQFPGNVQVIDIAKHLGFLEGNVIKYVARAGRKTENPTEDLLKARRYLDILIEKYEGGQA